MYASKGNVVGYLFKSIISNTWKFTFTALNKFTSFRVWADAVFSDCRRTKEFYRWCSNFRGI